MSAEQRTTFKIGDQTYLYDDFANFYNTYKQSYYDFARQYGGFNTDQVNQLDKVIQDSLDYARNNGQFDTTGDFEGNEVKNIKVLKKKFGKDEEVQQGLTGKNSWLSNFIAKAGQYMKKYEKPEDNTKWNYDKHNFGAYLKGHNQDAEEIFSNMDRSGENEENATRQYSERYKQLFDHLLRHQNQIKDLGFVFNENENIYDDNYDKTLQGLIDMFSKKTEDGTDYEYDKSGNRIFNYSDNDSNFDHNAVRTALRDLGAVGDGSYDYVRGFTSDKFQFLTEEERKKQEEQEIAEEQKKRQEEIDTTKKQWDQEFYNFKNNNNIPESVIYGRFTPVEDSFIEHYRNIPDNQWPYQTYGTRIDLNNIESYWNQFTESLRNQNGKAENNNYDSGQYTNQKALLQLMYENPKVNPQAFIDLGNDYYYIKNTVNDQGWGAVYNPINGSIKYVFLGDYYSNPNIKPIYDELRSNYLKKTYPDKYLKIFPQTPPGFKKGGFIKKYQSGDPIDFSSFNSNYYSKQNAKENNTSVREQQEGERYLSEKNKSQANPNAGLTYNDYWSLANAGANIASALVDPVTGFWVGAASTTSEFINEIARDGFQWKDAGNWIKGLGMDTVGLLPVIGDKLGTLNKTKQILFKFIPGLIGTIGTISSAANTPQIIDSLAKIIDDRPMTVNDWRNVAEGINLVVTGTNFGRGIVRTRKARNATDGSGALQIQVTDDLGNKKLLVVTGKDAAKIRTANKEKGLSGVNEEIHKLKSVEGAENYNAIVDNSKWNNYEWTGFSKENPETSGTDAAFPISRKQEKARIEVYRDPVEYSRVYRKKNPSQATIDSYNKKYIGDTPDKMRAREQEKINKQASRIVGQNEAIKSIESKVQDRLDLEINNKQTIEESIKSYNRSKDRIKNEENELKYWEDYKTNHPNLPGLEKSNTERKNNLEKRKKRHQQKYKDDFETNATKELNKLNKLIDALNKRKQDVEIAKRKDKYDMMRNFPKKEVIIFGKKHTFYPTEIKLPNENPYHISRDGNDVSFMQFNKQGGSINRNKLNKFLNYGKR